MVVGNPKMTLDPTQAGINPIHAGVHPTQAGVYIVYFGPNL